MKCTHVVICVIYKCCRETCYGDLVGVYIIRVSATDETYPSSTQCAGIKVRLLYYRNLVLFLWVQLNPSCYPHLWSGFKEQPWRGILSMLLTLAKRSIIPSSSLSPTHNISSSLAPHLHQFHNSLFSLLSYPPFLSSSLHGIRVLCDQHFFFLLMKSKHRRQSLKGRYKKVKSKKVWFVSLTKILIVNTGGNFKQMWVKMKEINVCFYWWFFFCMFSQTCSHLINMQRSV